MSFPKADFRGTRCEALRAVKISALLSIGLNLALTSHDAAFAASGATVTIPRGSATPVVLRAPANARCAFGAINAQSSQKLTAVSDAGGNVRYVVTVNSTARNGVLATLECTNSKAHTLVGLTLLPGAPGPRRAPIAAGRPPTIADLATTARFGALPGTPARFDVTTASAAQLAELHYPPRPDPQQNPGAYAVWRKLATTPGASLPTVPVPLPAPGASHGVSSAEFRYARTSGGRLKPTESAIGEPSVSQCGSLVLEFTSPLWEIEGSWNVPVVTGILGEISTSSTTVAFSGVSEGTEQDAFNIPSFGSFGSYYTWYQILNQRYGFNMPLAPGDAVFAYFYQGSQSDSTYNITIYDNTNNTSGYVTAGPPPSYGSGSYSAEWLEERPQSQLPLPYFTPVSIDGLAQSYDEHFFYVDGTASPWYPGLEANDSSGFLYLLQMTSYGTWSGDRMCSSSIIPGTVPEVSVQFNDPF